MKGKRLETLLEEINHQWHLKTSFPVFKYALFWLEQGSGSELFESHLPEVAQRHKSGQLYPGMIDKVRLDS